MFRVLSLLILLGLLPQAALAGEQPPRRGLSPNRSPAPSETRYSVAFHAGYRAFHLDSQLFADNEFDFGITDGDFTTALFGGEFDFEIVPLLSITAGLTASEAETTGSYLDFTYDDGSEIAHSAYLGVTEFTVGARFHLVGERSPFRPYVLGGISGTLYEYRESGDFVDFETADIFFDDYLEESFLIGFFAGAGADLAIVQRADQRIDLYAEYRYSRSEGEHQDGFAGFGDLTLARSGGLLGIRLRF